MENLLDDLEETSDEDGETLTAAEVVQKLEEAWLNEKFSPELLEVKSDIVDCILEQITQMEENIQRAKKLDVKVPIHKMEIDRIRFVLSSYLRTRLKKIEANPSHILDQEAKRSSTDASHLSPAEFQFAQQYIASMDSHYQTLGLRYMPPNLQTLDHQQIASHPNYDSYVFLRVRDDTDGVLVEEETLDSREEVLDMKVGDQHIMRYRLVADLVASSAVKLI